MKNHKDMGNKSAGSNENGSKKCECTNPSCHHHNGKCHCGSKLSQCTSKDCHCNVAQNSCM